MTVTELAKLLAQHIAQGRGEYQMAIFQWNHGMQEFTEIVVREASEVVEAYSGTRRYREGELTDNFSERYTSKPRKFTPPPAAPKPVEVDDDPTAGVFDDDDLI